MSEQQRVSTAQSRSPHEIFTAAIYIESLERYHDVLVTRREDINRINVFPVADQDTGSNLLHTTKALLPGKRPEKGLPEVAAEVADSALIAGRGASGLILSQAITGLSRHLTSYEIVGPGEMAGALRTASDKARGAVADPVEGTMITCARRAAEAATWSAERGASLGAVMSAARSEAWAAVFESPSLLGVLAEAGVVDSGATGYAMMIDVFDSVVNGTQVEAVHFDTHVATRGATPEDRFELIVNLSQAGDSDELSSGWVSVGSSIAIARKDDEIRAHVHTSNVISAYEIACSAGRPTRVEMTDLGLYAVEAGNDVTVVLSPRIEEARELLALQPGRLLIPGDPASLTHIAETSRRRHLTVVVIADVPEFVWELAGMHDSRVTVHEVANTNQAATFM